MHEFKRTIFLFYSRCKLKIILIFTKKNKIRINKYKWNKRFHLVYECFKNKNKNYFRKLLEQTNMQYLSLSLFSSSQCHPKFKSYHYYTILSPYITILLYSTKYITPSYCDHHQHHLHSLEIRCEQKNEIKESNRSFMVKQKKKMERKFNEYLNKIKSYKE